MDAEEILQGRDAVPLGEFAALKGITRKAAELRRDRRSLGVQTHKAGEKSPIMVPASEIRRWCAERDATGMRIQPGEVITLRIAADAYGALSVNVA